MPYITTGKIIPNPKMYLSQHFVTKKNFHIQTPPPKTKMATIHPPPSRSRSPVETLRVKAPSFDILQVPEATGEEQGIHTSPIWTTHPICHQSTHITVGSRKKRQPNIYVTEN